jgi:toxin YoeB
MARKVAWTLSAIEDRFHIYNFWEANNDSDSYSKKLEKLFNGAANLIAEFLEIGTKTNNEGVRVKILKEFILFYTFNDSEIKILRVWD